MSYARAAAAAQAYAAALRRADADRQTMRAVDALAKFAGALAELKNKAQAEATVEHVGARAVEGRMGGVGLSDLLPFLADLAEFAESFGARKGVADALEALFSIIEAHPDADAFAVAAGLEQAAAAEAAVRTAEADRKREKEEAEQALSERYAERLRQAPQTREDLDAIIAEMDAQRPKLAPAVWKLVACAWEAAGAASTEKAARAAIEAKIAAVCLPPRPELVYDSALTA